MAVTEYIDLVTPEPPGKIRILQDILLPPWNPIGPEKVKDGPLSIDELQEFLWQDEEEEFGNYGIPPPNSLFSQPPLPYTGICGRHYQEGISPGPWLRFRLNPTGTASPGIDTASPGIDTPAPRISTAGNRTGYRFIIPRRVEYV